MVENGELKMDEINTNLNTYTFCGDSLIVYSVYQFGVSFGFPDAEWRKTKKNTLETESEINVVSSEAANGLFIQVFFSLSLLVSLSIILVHCENTVSLSHVPFSRTWWLISHTWAPEHASNKSIYISLIIVPYHIGHVYDAGFWRVFGSFSPNLFNNEIADN